jgi:hypothetical protein
MMSTSPKSANQSSPEAKSERADETYPQDFVSLFVKGVQRVAEIQKQALEHAVRQNAEIVDAYRKAARSIPTVASRVELVEEALNQFVKAQESVTNQVVEQTLVLVKTVQEHSDAAAKVTMAFTGLIQDSIQHAIEMEKAVLDSVKRRGKAVAGTKKPAA